MASGKRERQRARKASAQGHGIRCPLHPHNQSVLGSERRSYSCTGAWDAEHPIAFANMPLDRAVPLDVCVAPAGNKNA